MASRPAASSSFAASSHANDPIDLLELFNASPAHVKASKSLSSAAAKTSIAASSSSSSSFAPAEQQITLSSAPYNVKLSLNDRGKSELCFEAANAIKPSSPPESWKFGGSADVGDHTYCCCFSADSKYFITGGSRGDANIRLWNPSTRTLVATLTGHINAVNSLISFTLNGRMMLASASYDDTIRIWEWKDSAASSSPLCIATLQSGSSVDALAYCSKQNVLISGQYQGIIKFWSASDWQCMQTLSSSYVRALSLSCDESKLASGHQDGSIHIWDMSTRTEIKTWKAATNYITSNGLCFSPSQPDILVAASGDGTCATWKCATGSKIGSISSQFGSLNLPASFSPNGNYFVTVSNSKQLILVDSKTNNVIKTMDGCPSVKHISSACFSPDGNYLACASLNNAKSLYIWASSSSASQSAASSANEIVARTLVPESALDFRITALSDSTCLLVARLASGASWAITTAAVDSPPQSPKSPKTMITINEWTMVPFSMSRPIVRFLPIDGITLKIEDKNASDSRSIVPIFIGKNANLLSESYSSATQLVASIEAKERDLSAQAALVKQEAAKMQSYLVKQESGMDEALLELSFGNLSDPSCVNKCKSILESHLYSSMSELRSICSASSSLPSASVPKGSSASLSSLSSSSSSSSNKKGQEEEEKSVSSDAIDWKSLSIGRELGDGGFGSVFACELTLSDGTKRPVAMKVPARTARVTLSASSSSSPKKAAAVPQEPAARMSSAQLHASSKCIQNEIATFKRIEHPNVVRYIGFTVEPSPSSPTCMVLQYCAGGNLQQLLDSNKQGCGSDEKGAFQLAMQIASGMTAVHSLGVAHRDLKPANVLLCPLPGLSMSVAKITDCGSANLKDLNAEQSRMTGVTFFNGLTSRYCAPELLDDDLVEEWESSYAQDIWAFGLLLFQLRTGKAPFEKSKSDQTVIVSIVSGKPPGVWPQEDGQQWDWLRTLASQCLELQPSDRLAHFEAMGASADGRTAFSAIEKKLCEARPEWAKEVMANMLKFQRMEIRDVFLKDQNR